LTDFESRRKSLRWLAAGAAAAALPVETIALASAQPRPMRTVSVHGEFGTLKTAIVHDGSNARTFTMDEQQRLIAPAMLRAHPETGPSTRERLIEQHRKLRAILAQNGVVLLDAVTVDRAPFQVFARDPSFAIGDTLFIASLKDPWRHAELGGLRELRQQFASVVSLSSSQSSIEGGDVMVLDGQKKVLVGVNRNTDEAGYRTLAATDAIAGLELIRVPHESLHLDCCLAPLPDGGALYSLATLPESSMKLLRRAFDQMIPLDLEEAALHLAANLFWLDGARVISSVRTPKTNRLLSRRGFQVIELDYSELTALWGSFRCTVCPVERSATG
jgi:N-dimethylarginine dimethylaminohydrolase